MTVYLALCVNKKYSNESFVEYVFASEEDAQEYCAAQTTRGFFVFVVKPMEVR